MTREEAGKIAGLSPCGRLVELPGAGHVEAVDVLGPARYAALVVETAHRACGAAG
ncbi:hypothetical protein [Pyrodictium occultum]|uniref:hypothetical protein n=1 Tax=Pyrodictium occultum TaxID=2309 RepID=UPI0014435A9E|nr:hypothetical protein [Pyrodictium occultum]